MSPVRANLLPHRLVMSARPGQLTLRSRSSHTGIQWKLDPPTPPDCPDAHRPLPEPYKCADFNGATPRRRQPHPRSSSWPTASTRDWKDSPGMALESTDRDGSHRNRADQLARAVYKHGPAAPASSSTDGSRQESSLPWPTPQAFDAVNANTPQTWMDRQKRNSNMSRASRPTALSVAIQMPCWQTATVSTGAHRQKDGSMTDKLDRQVGGTLNPRWVCTLMNVPVHWVKP